MSDLISEVEQDLKEENYYQTIKTYLPIFFIFCILVIIAFASFNYYKKKQQRVDEIETKAFYDYINSNDKNAKLNLRKTSHNLEALAKINKSFTSSESRISDLKEIIHNRKYDSLIKDYAKINLADELVHTKTFDNEIYDLLSSDDKSNLPWQNLSKLYKAIFLIKENKKTEAKKIILDILNKEDTPQEIIKWANQLNSQLDQE